MACVTWAHDLKLGRAREHLKEVEAEIECWTRDDGYTMAVHPDPEPPRYVIRAENIREPDDALALRVGDCLHNARAALEYVAYALGNAGAGGEMDENQARRSSFPIVGDVDRDGFRGRGPDLFEERAPQMLATVNSEAREAIKRLQPYNDGDIWEYHGLWVLGELARLDRHRFLHFGAVRGEGLELDRTQSRNIKMEGEIDIFKGLIYPEIEESAELGRVILHPADSERPMEMNFTRGLALTFATVDDGIESIDAHPVDWVLRDCVREAEQVLRQLRRFLPS
jgi:hypothetical protein